MSKSVAVQLGAILNEYAENVQEIAQKGMKRASSDTAKKLRSSSPRKTGEYSSGWTSKRLDSDTYVTYNSKMPGLTHLLEDGHVIRNKKGEYGRVAGRKHIAPAAEEGAELYTQLVEREL